MNIINCYLLPFLVGMLLFEVSAIVGDMTLAEVILFYADFTNPAFYTAVLTIYFTAQNSQYIFQKKESKEYKSKFPEEDIIFAADMFKVPTKEPIYELSPADPKKVAQLIAEQKREKAEREKKFLEAKKKTEEKNMVEVKRPILLPPVYSRDSNRDPKWKKNV